MEAYALSQGITKSWQSMTQAEQSMLRYNYIMSVTGAQQGDFTRTQASFANQTRLLTLNFQTLGATIGQGFIAAILPAIQALNVLMAVLQRAAEAFRDFMYVLTGYKPQGSQSGIVNDMSGNLADIGSAGTDAAGGIGDAADAAEELEKTLSVMDFDELHQLSDVSAPDTGGSGSGGGGGTGGGIGGIGDFGSITDAFENSKLPDAVNEWAERIRKAFLAHDWDKLGEEIAWGINKGLETIYDAINWKNVGPKITAFTTAFTQTFNSLVDHIDWDLLGRTIGAGVNTIVNTLNQLVEGIDWVKLGKSFSKGLTGLVDEVNWKKLGNLLGNGFMISWEIFYGFATDFDYKKLGTSIGKLLNGALEKINFKIIGDSLATGLNGAFDLLISFADTFNWRELEDAIASSLNSFFEKFDSRSLSQAINKWADKILDTVINAIKKTDWNLIGKRIGELLEGIDFIKIGKKVGKALWDAINAGFKIYEGIFEAAPLETAILTLVGVTKLLKTDAITKFVKSIENGIDRVIKLKDAFLGFKSKVTEGGWLDAITTSVDNIRNSLSRVERGVIVAAASFGEFAVVKDAMADITTESGNILGNLAEIVSSAALAGSAMYVALGPAGLAFAAVTGIVAAIAGITEGLKEKSGINQFSDEMDKLAEEVNRNTSEIKTNLENIKTSFEEAGVAEVAIAQNLVSEYEQLRGKTELTADEQYRLKDISQQLVDLIPGLNGYIDEQTGYLDIQNQTLEDLVANMALYAKQQALQEGLVDLYKQQFNADKNVEDAENAYKESLENYMKQSGFTQKAIDGLIKGTLTLDKIQEDYANNDAIASKEYGFAQIWHLRDAYAAATEEAGEFYEALDEAKQQQTEVNSEIERTTEALEANGIALQKHQQDTINDKINTTEFKQAVSDLRTEFSNFNVSLSDAFAQKLALDDTGAMADSLIEMLQKTKEQVQLTSEELNQIFANIAPKISESFTNALAEKSPEMQAQIVMILGEMASGAEVSAADIKTVFGTLGYYLPDSIINAFSEKGEDVQLSTIDLMSKVSGGEKLVEGNLLDLFNGLGLNISDQLIYSLSEKEADVQYSAIMLLSQLEAGAALSENQLAYTFQSLGIGIVNDGIIDSLANSEPDVQKQAIKLLGEIQSAAQSERQPLIDEFNSLGVGTINDGLLEAIDGLDADTRSKVIDLLSEITGATSERKGEIYEELKGLGLDVGNGLINGMGEKERDLSKAGIGLSDASLEAMKSREGYETGSPSKKTTDIGEDVGQGLINGVKSKEGELRNTFIEIAKSGLQGLQDGFQLNSNIIDSALNQIVSKFNELGDTLYNAGKNAARSFSDGFQAIYIPTPHMYISSWRTHQLGGGQTMQTPSFSVSWYKAGGLFTKATIAGIGEAGNEAVLPLENKRTMSMIANSILDNASVGTGLSKDEMRQAIAEGVAIAMMNNSQNQPPINLYATLYTEDNEVLARAVTKGQRSIDYRTNPTIKYGY